MVRTNRYFLAASHRDSAWADAMAHLLRQRGHDVWYDADSLRLGNDFVSTLRQEAANRDFIVLVSPDALASKWIQMELNVALQNGMRIIPVIIQPTELSGLLAQRASVDATSKRPEQVIAAIDDTAEHVNTVPVSDRPLPAPTSVFLSHASEDVGPSRRVKHDLEAHGAYVWADFDAISSGDFYAAINEGLSKCNWLVLLVSPTSLRTDKIVIREEVNAALGMRHTGEMHGVIPVVIETFDVRGMPPIWRNLHRYDAVADYDNAMNRVLTAIGLL